MNAGLILARTDSKRLPNKAISNLGHKKLIQWCIDGVQNTGCLEPILVTSDRDIDRPLIEIANKNNIKFFQGSLNNVAKRVFDCVDYFNIDLFARVNGDSPFINKQLIKGAIETMESDMSIDLLTNLIPRKFPYGMSVEILRSTSYKKHYKELNTSDFQEHITSWFYQNRELINIFELKYAYGNDHSIRFTVDTHEDHTNIEKIILDNPDFDFYNSEIDKIVDKFRNKK